MSVLRIYSLSFSPLSFPCFSNMAKHSQLTVDAIANVVRIMLATKYFTNFIKTKKKTYSGHANALHTQSIEGHESWNGNIFNVNYYYYGKTAAAAAACVFAFRKLRRADTYLVIYIYGMTEQTKGHKTAGWEQKMGKRSKMSTLMASTGRHWASTRFSFHNNSMPVL